MENKMKLTAKVYVVTHETKHGVDVYLRQSLKEVEALKDEIFEEEYDDQYFDWDIHEIEWEFTDE